LTLAGSGTRTPPERFRRGRITRGVYMDLQRFAVACHEAGHCVIALARRQVVTGAEITEPDTTKTITGLKAWGAVYHSGGDPVVAFAGPVAQAFALHTPFEFLGWGQATYIAAQARAERHAEDAPTGEGQTIPSVWPTLQRDPVALRCAIVSGMRGDVDAAMTAIRARHEDEPDAGERAFLCECDLAEAQRTAVKLVEDWHPEIKSLAGLLLDRGTMTGAQISLFWKDAVDAWAARKALLHAL
jgi:hypothetical protein